MKAVQIANDWRRPARIAYKTDITDIREAVNAFGRANDVVELYDSKNNLKAIAIWGMGAKGYKYCTEPSINSAYRVFTN